MTKKNRRHSIEHYYSIRVFVDGDTVSCNPAKWTEKTSKGLQDFVLSNIPNWQKLTILKRTQSVDLQKHEGSLIVNHKLSSLAISRMCTPEILSTKVNADLTKDGKIPKNISEFLEDRER